MDTLLGENETLHPDNVQNFIEPIKLLKIIGLLQANTEHYRNSTRDSVIPCKCTVALSSESHSPSVSLDIQFILGCYTVNQGFIENQGVVYSKPGVYSMDGWKPIDQHLVTTARAAAAAYSTPTVTTRIVFSVETRGYPPW